MTKNGEGTDTRKEVIRDIRGNLKKNARCEGRVTNNQEEKRRKDSMREKMNESC